MLTVSLAKGQGTQKELFDCDTEKLLFWSEEYILIAITLSFTLTRSGHTGSPFMKQIGLFESYSYSIAPCATPPTKHDEKKSLKKLHINVYIKREIYTMNAIP